MTAATSSGSPADRGRIDPSARVFWVLCLLGIVVYYLVLSVDWSRAARPSPRQQVANALTLGAIYALVALGYTMVYGIIELINFAHGDVFMVGTFMSLFFLSSPPAPLDFLGLHLSGPIDEPLTLAVVMLGAFAFGMTVMGLINVTIERFAYRPLRHAPRVAPLITAIGVSLILQNIMQIIVGTGDRLVPQVFPNDQGRRSSGASIGVLNIFILVVALVLMFVLQLFVGRTRLGRAMRATAQDQQAAQLMGVDLNQTIAITFLIGGALAGAAGVFQGQYFGFVRFDLGFNAGLKAFTAAVLGGIGNLDRRRARRLHDRLHRGLRRGDRPAALVAGDRVHRPDPRPRLPAEPASSASRSESGHDRRVGRRRADRAEQADVAPEPLTDYLAVHRSIDDPRSAMAIVDRRCCRCSPIVPPFSVFQQQDVWLIGLLERRRLRAAGARPQHRRRPGRPARPGLRGVLRDRRVRVRLRRVAVLGPARCRSW